MPVETLKSLYTLLLTTSSSPPPSRHMEVVVGGATAVASREPAVGGPTTPADGPRTSTERVSRTTSLEFSMYLDNHGFIGPKPLSARQVVNTFDVFLLVF